MKSSAQPKESNLLGILVTKTPIHVYIRMYS
uniref:Uncharacterized protein n=1 Tax=Rhizophora mucronata TaxID=61149 RepID=A0A2P2NEX2_RHIMU